MEKTKTEQVVLFEQVWGMVNNHFYDSNFNGVNWNKTFHEYKVKIENCKNTDTLFYLLNRMLFKLNSSHCGVGLVSKLKDVVSPYIFKSGEIGIDIRIIENQIIVTKVLKNSSAEKAKIKTGFVVKKINNLTLDEIEEFVEYKPPFNSRNSKFHLTSEVLRRIYGEPNTSIKIDFLDRNANLYSETLIRTERKNGFSLAKGMPLAFLETKSCFFADDIAYLALNAFSLANSEIVLNNLRKVRNSKGLIIDLRGNDGGSIDAMKLLLGNFVSKNRKYGVFINRAENNEDFIKPSKPAYKGEVVVLVDEMSISGAENMAGIIQQLRIGTVIGNRTPGQLLWGRGYLINDSVALAIPIYKLEYLNGYNPENNGIIPDIEIGLNIVDLLKGKDSQLEKALEYLKEKIKINK